MRAKERDNQRQLFGKVCHKFRVNDRSSHCSSVPWQSVAEQDGKLI